MRLNWFSTKVLNLHNVEHTWSFEFRAYIYEKWEKSSIRSEKYLAPVVERVREGPQRSMWISSRDCEALDIESGNGNLWLLEHWQALQTWPLLNEQGMLHDERICLTISAVG